MPSPTGREPWPPIPQSELYSQQQRDEAERKRNGWNVHYETFWKKEVLPHATFTDDGQVIIKEQVFDGLCTYSTTLPSGTYLYKCWKAKRPDGWWIAQYVPHPDPGLIGIKWWKVVGVY